MIFNSLDHAYAWLNSHINYERNLGQVQYTERAFELEAFRALLRQLDDPQRGPRTIHIAGSAGKGSSALFLEAMLRSLGLRVATYTSPHFREYRERIRIDGAMISPEGFCRALGQVAAQHPAEHPQTPESEFARSFKTVFELLTATFFIAARNAHVDWMIVETGLGGRLDATNVLDPGPVLWTRIGMEHAHLLGPTLSHIAREKAAILKPGGWAVYARQENDEVVRVFEERGRETGAPVMSADSLWRPLSETFIPGGMRLVYPFEGNQLLSVKTHWLGPFLARNLQGALAVISHCRSLRLLPAVPNFRDRISAALRETSLPGRMEPIPHLPHAYVDGGHCPPAAAAIAEVMSDHVNSGAERAVLVVGMVNDKDHRAFFEALARWPRWRALVCYTLDTPRAEPAESLAQKAQGLFPRIETRPDAAKALEFATSLAEENDRIIATGSTYGVAAITDWGIRYGQRPPD